MASNNKSLESNFNSLIEIGGNNGTLYFCKCSKIFVTKTGAMNHFKEECTRVKRNTISENSSFENDSNNPITIQPSTSSEQEPIKKRCKPKKIGIKIRRCELS